jgi:hypothetical protein
MSLRGGLNRPKAVWKPDETISHCILKFNFELFMRLPRSFASLKGSQ